MENKKYFSVRFSCIVVCLMVGVEALGSYLLKNRLTSIETEAILRLTQIGLLTLLLGKTPSGFSLAGLAKKKWPEGVRSGVNWVTGLSGITVFVGGVLFLTGKSPFLLVGFSISPQQPFIFFITAAVIGPVCEELFFRGILYSSLRRYGTILALLLTTTLFAGMHMPWNGLPMVQIIGGLIFAISFEASKSLLAPLIIHIAGNLAIFSIEWAL